MKKRLEKPSYPSLIAETNHSLMNSPIIDKDVWKRIVDEVLTKFNGIGQYLDNPLTTKVAEELQKKHSYLTLRGWKFVRASIEKALSHIDSDCDKAKLILTEAKEMLELERES